MLAGKNALWQHRQRPFPPATLLNDTHIPDDDPRPLPPEPPLPSDCCDSGCDPCVYDLYNEELQAYRERLARWRERNPDAD